jgi:hypothetical protein
MPPEIIPITDRKQPVPDDVDPFDALCDAVHRMDHRTAETAARVARIEARLDTLAAAWSAGGLRGLRQALNGDRDG